MLSSLFKYLIIGLVFFSFLACETKPCVENKEVKMPEPNLYHDTLLSFAIKLVDSVYDGGLLKSKQYLDDTVIIEDRLVLNAIRDFRETWLFDEYPSLKNEYNESLKEQLNDSTERITFHGIDTTYYNYKFVTLKTIETWRRWYRTRNDSLSELSFRYLEFSRPLLSSDKKYLVIEVHDNCNGLCGEGRLFLFENKNGKWELTKNKGLWIS